MAPRRVLTFGAIVKKTEKLFQEGEVTIPLGNDSDITAATVIPENYNTVLYGPVTINDGASLTIGNNADLIVLKLDDANPVEIPPARVAGDSFVVIDGAVRIVDKDNSTINRDTILSSHDTIFYDPVTIYSDSYLKIGDGASLTIKSIDDVAVSKPVSDISLGGDSVVNIDGTLRIIDRSDSTIRTDTVVRDHNIDTVLYGPVTVNSGFDLKIDDGAELKITTVNDVGGLYGGLGNSTSLNTTILDNYNAVLFGPITVKEGDSFNIGDGSAAKIINISDVFSAIKYN